MEGWLLDVSGNWPQFLSLWRCHVYSCEAETTEKPEKLMSTPQPPLDPATETASPHHHPLAFQTLGGPLDRQNLTQNMTSALQRRGLLRSGW